MDTKVLVDIISLLAGFVIGVLSLWVAVYSGKIELRKRKPEAVTHGCRVANLVVYTFITGKKTQTPPVCPYLDTSDHITCLFSPESHHADALKMKGINKDKCYIALFARDFDLE